MSIKKETLIKFFTVKRVLFLILFIIVLYGLYLLIKNSYFSNQTKIDYTVSIQSTIITDKEFLEEVKFGSVKNVQNMLEVGANPEAIDENGRNALSLAASFNTNPQVIKTLIKYDVEVNKPDVNGFTPLMYAIISNSDLHVISNLIKYKADVNAVNISGTSVLMIALALSSNMQLIEKLIAKGANVNYQDPHNVTPLMVALRSSNNPKVIKLLLKKGADPNVRDDLGITAGDILRSNTKLSKDPELLEAIK